MGDGRNTNMKKLKLTKDIELEWWSNSNYSIITPTNTFNNINDAIAIYDELKEAKYIANCELCNKYFVKYKANRRKYCSDSCSEEANRLKQNKRDLHNEYAINHRNNRSIEEYKTQKGVLPQGFNQCDFNINDKKSVMLGEVKLFQSHKKDDKGEYDWEYEHNLIKKFKRDLYRDNIINP